MLTLLEIVVPSVAPCLFHDLMTLSEEDVSVRVYDTKLCERENEPRSLLQIMDKLKIFTVNHALLIDQS